MSFFYPKNKPPCHYFAGNEYKGAQAGQTPGAIRLSLNFFVTFLVQAQKVNKKNKPIGKTLLFGACSFEGLLYCIK